ncbi:OsmC family protein [Chitinolyticbacter meiyuanensis]|uniref:OsmC family protein n=1 Tax=Chitinolyticbacter meiyuanensis TaxID=682798 RepID=UPI0011E5B49A|nr:OsmC family protein [Chitinolyticbacter meiyuanensis]
MSAEARWHAANGRTACDIALPHGEVVADLDAEAGGGAHPSPHDLLDAALAACTTLTLELYIKRKDWPVSSIRTEVGHEKATDTYLMRRTIHIDGAIDDEQRAALLRIAEACPVHKTLSGKIATHTELQQSGA